MNLGQTVANSANLPTPGDESARRPGALPGGAVLMDPTGQQLRTADVEALNTLYDKARACGSNIDAILQLARELGGSVPLPQNGNTLMLWQTLATLGAADLTVARIIEPHLDAVAILAQAGQQELNISGSTWGVFAAQAPDQQLHATLDGNGWTLTGNKPWCSLARELSHALVTARTHDAVQLFAVDLHDTSLSRSTRPWTALGLSAVPSQGLTFDKVPAEPVGAPQWYLSRPGFAWGGAGVAAIWLGGATAIARRFHRHCLSRKPDQIALWQLGTIDQALWSATVAFHAAAILADSQEPGGIPANPALTAARLRATAVQTSEVVLRTAAHGMGPEPLAFEPEHGQRVADLELYLRQDHAERSGAMQGSLLLDNSVSGWPGKPPW